MYEDSEYLTKVTKSVRKGGIVLTVVGGLFFIVCAVMAVLMLKEGNIWMLFAVFALVFGIMLGFGIRNTVSPMSAINKNQLAILLKYAPDMDRKIIYRDKYVTVSEQAIALTKKPVMLAAREDVIAAWTYTHSINFIPVEKTINLYTPQTTELKINVYGLSKKKIGEIFNNIAPYLPNCRFGYSPENAKYLGYMRQQYKASLKNK